ncbi:MAG: hypothetical protein OSB45_13390 [Pseudomonadales bacterium]|nr:hypothetical protein [Pseudomonadales bacterium]
MGPELNAAVDVPVAMLALAQGLSSPERNEKMKFSLSAAVSETVVSFRRVFALAIMLVVIAACTEPVEPTAIPSDKGVAKAGFTRLQADQPLAYTSPVHPFMAQAGLNSMHGDSYNSDVHAVAGPQGLNTTILSRVGSQAPGGMCATTTFSSDGKLITLCASMMGFRINLLEPRTLRLLAEYSLPLRSSSYRALLHLDRSIIMEDTSGAYFYLDHEDRVVMADNKQIIHRIAYRQTGRDSWEFYQEESWDLSATIPSDCLRPNNPFPAGECDPITAVMPDYSGLIWWVTRAGRVGTLGKASGALNMIQLADEEIQNGFAVAQDGVYIVSDKAMYAFRAAPSGLPEVIWREPYDRGSARKVGSINQGSGTAPTLLSNYVTITDNADGRINLLVYRRQLGASSERLVCKVPLFSEGHSAAENSMIAFNRSIILENNAGYTSVFGEHDWATAGGGIVRVDVRENESGCDIIWQSSERAPSVVPKLALSTGIAYFYNFMPAEDGTIAWYLMGLDYVTGETLFKIHTGNGKNFDNNWAPITLGSDGTAYVGTSKGLLAIYDEI